MKQWHLFCLLPLMAACDSGHSGSGELISVDFATGDKIILLCSICKMSRE